MHYDLIGVFARSQQDFPKGVGVKRSLFVKRNFLGAKDLCDCSRMELNNLIKSLREEYNFMKVKNDYNISKAK